ncbi:MAG: hypothetical protein FWD72_02905 [Eggerthellaceae bacterium]|nr:hypothetical protein [Eggerthellaceae bacterium]
MVLTWWRPGMSRRLPERHRLTKVWSNPASKKFFEDIFNKSIRKAKLVIPTPSQKRAQKQEDVTEFPSLLSPTQQKLFKLSYPFLKPSLMAVYVTVLPAY